MSVRLVAAVAFLVVLTIWTWLLIEPKPVPEALEKLLSVSDWLYFLLAKLLHTTGYAVLTILLVLALPQRKLPIALGLAFLLLHGVATEIIQTYVQRHGCIRDVLIDWFGISIGAAIMWRFRQPLLARTHIGKRASSLLTRRAREG